MLVIGPPAACLMAERCRHRPLYSRGPKISGKDPDIHYFDAAATIAPAGRPHQISTNPLFHLAIPRKTRYTI